jgi:hypothetical protein
MMDFESLLQVLKFDILKIAGLERDRLDLLNTPMNPAFKDERDRDLKLDIERKRENLARVIGEFVSFPPHHKRHDQPLGDFHKAGGFEKSVFVMTKFPDPHAGAVADQQLDALIQTVCRELKQRGYLPRIANDHAYHAQLWDNVELYLLGCSRGIAIVEDKYLPELNPNVAMEWGWMRGMGRNVLYLIEKDFKKRRADWNGLIEYPFDWADPEPGVRHAIGAWLK